MPGLRSKKFRRVVVALSVIVGLFFAAAGWLVWSGLQDHLIKADVAVVLGNKVEADGQPSPRLKARLDRTAALYREGWFPAILVSGGTGVEGFDEAAVMKRYLVAAGVPASAVVEDPHGVTTWATAENTARLLKEKQWKSVLVVSQYFHVPRSVLAMRRQGIADVGGAGARFYEGRDAYSIPRELAGYVSYWLR